MQLSPMNIALLVDEYTTIALESVATDNTGKAVVWDELEKALTSTGNWTPKAAQALVMLARDYGSFMLRNALALSIALGIEDGELGF